MKFGGFLKKINNSIRLRRIFKKRTLYPRSCPHCSNDRSDTLLDVDRNFVGIKTAVCCQCGFIFTNPYLIEDDIRKFYEELYRDVVIAEPKAEEYADDNLALDNRSVYFNNLLEPFDKSVFLDVGSGEGSLSKEIRRCNSSANIFLVEPNPHYLSYAIKNSQGEGAQSLAKLTMPSPPTLITMIHVLEHIVDPLDTLKELALLSDDNTVLFIDVPDASRYDTLSDIHFSHCNHFVVSTLSSMLHSAGFSIENIEQHNPPDLPKSIYTVATKKKEMVNDNAECSTEIEKDSLEAKHRTRELKTSLLKYGFQRLFDKKYR